MDNSILLQITIVILGVIVIIMMSRMGFFVDKTDRFIQRFLTATPSKQISSIVGLGFIIIVIVLIFYRMGVGGEIKHDPEPWGQFGDYFGGVLNPIFSLFNMFLLYRIFTDEASRAKQARIDDVKRSIDETSRHKELLANSVRPWGDFRKNTIDKIELSIGNHGNGTLIITRIEWFLGHDKINSIKEYLFSITNNLPTETFKIVYFESTNAETLTLSVNETTFLYALRPKTKTISTLNHHGKELDYFVSSTNDLICIIHYTDIYGTLFPPIRSSPNWGLFKGYFSSGGSFSL